MNKKWNTVEVLRHSRHDWMNKLQLLKGNLALGRIDRANEMIEEIIIEAKNEAKLTNLNMPILAELLMTYNWRGTGIKLEYEVLADERNISFVDQEIAIWCDTFLERLNKSVSIAGNHQIYLTIQLFQDDARFFFDFNGIIQDKADVEQWLGSQHNGSSRFALSSYEIKDEELTAVLQIL